MDTPSDWLKDLFSPQNLETPAARSNLGYAFQKLCLEYITRKSPSLQGVIGFDPISLEAAIMRFHRDAYGVHHFESYLEEQIKKEAISQPQRAALISRVQGMSVRINSSNPRKTRVAAAFSLWFSTLRPLHLTGTSCHGLTTSQLSTLPGACNFYIAALYLSQFGEIVLGEGDDKIERLNRIQYDLTFRDLNLSSLELLYCSILRAKKPVAVSA